MEVLLPNRQKVSLNPQDFVAQGGEGAVYVKNATAYKIYADPAKALPIGKIQELAVLSDPRIIRPQDVLRNRKSEPVGYTMRALAGTFALCQLFTRAFRDRHGLGPDRILALVQAMRAGIAHVHGCGILIVDLSEMNVQVAADFKDVFFIDVDSYQTPHFPATALTESVRDRHSATFSPGSDWFSFAVVSFQMFVGIHPYKGKHPTLKTLDARMQANVSVLSKRGGIALPGACQPLTVLPQAYRDWYEAVLDRGERLPPPTGPVLSLIVTAASIAPPVIVSGAVFRVQPVQTFEDNILAAWEEVVVTTRAVYMRGKRVSDLPPGVTGVVHAALTPRHGIPVIAFMKSNAVHLFDAIHQQSIGVPLAADALSSSGGRLYVRQGGTLLEIAFLETPDPRYLFVQACPRGSVMEQATGLWEGVASQSMMGACYVSLLPRSGVCHQVRLAELDTYQIVSARFAGGVLVVVGARGGAYDRFVFRFDDAYREYDVRHLPDTGFSEANFTVLASGVCLHLLDDDTLEVFSRQKGSAGLRLVREGDPSTLGCDCRMLTWDGGAAFARENTLYRFTMQSPVTSGA